MGKQLHAFQNDSPMAQFLGYYLKDLMVSLRSHLTKKEIMDKAGTYHVLASLDPLDKRNHVFTKQVDIGFAANLTLEKVTEKKAANEQQVLAFRNKCISLLAGMRAKLLRKSSLKYSIVHYLLDLSSNMLVSSSPDPAEILIRSCRYFCLAGGGLEKSVMNSFLSSKPLSLN